MQTPSRGGGFRQKSPPHRTAFNQKNENKMNSYTQHEVLGGVPVKMWTRGVPVEDVALKQLENTARLPIVFKHVAVMPDVHYGLGATIGSVVPTLKAIIPAAVGVDIGCGMMACKTTLFAADLPDNLGPLRSEIEKAVPHGSAPKTYRRNGSTREVGAWTNPPSASEAAGRFWWTSSMRFAWTTRS